MKHFSIDIVAIVCYNYNDMEYSINKLTKLICILSALMLCFALFACVNSEDDGATSATEEISQAPVLSQETAIKLIEQDKLITEIFVCNSLCDSNNTKAERIFVSEDNQYYYFSAIESLIDSTYVKNSGDKSFFFAYPANNVPSVMNDGGVTSVFNHKGSSYDGFINTDSISVSDTDDENIKTINGKTEQGSDIQFRAVFQNEVWLLEKGIYRLNPPQETEFSSRMDNSRLGSFSTLKGEILVIELFITDEESQITAAEEKAFHQKIAAAAESLAIQAASYGEKTNFTYKTAYFEHENVLGLRVLDFDLMFAETGFGTLEAFAGANFEISEYDNYLFVVCMDKKIETSVGVFDGTQDTEHYFGERILISPSADEQDIYISMLQLLGAYGYNQGKLDTYTESLYGFYFPNDCMLAEDMSLSVMSPVTAYICGVTDKLDRLYRIFIPNN